MTTRPRPLLGMVLGATLAVMLGVSPCTAGVYYWTNPAGGEWDVSGNWNIPGYPTLFFDFAVFNQPISCAVDATDAASIGSIAGILVVGGDTRLSAYDGFGAQLSVSPEGEGGALTLVRGFIRSSGVHLIGPGGLLILGAGAGLQSSATNGLGFDLQPGGTLRGDGGSLDGQVLRNLGTLSPGLAPATPGILLIGSRLPAGYLQGASGVLEMDLAGTEPGTGYDQLRVVDGSLGVTLGGTLRVSLADGFLPGGGGRFDLLVAPSLVGSFETVELPEIPGTVFTLTYEPDRVSLLVEGTTEIAATLDLQLGTCANPLSIGKQGVIPSALLGTAAVNAADIDPGSIRLEGVAPVFTQLQDVGGPPGDDGCPLTEPDGVMDLVLHFPAVEVLSAYGPAAVGDEVVFHLAGALFDGTPIAAEDRMVMRGGSTDEATSKVRKATVAGLWPLVRPGDGVQRVSYSLNEPVPVRLEVFSVTGELVERLVDEAQSAGLHAVEWSPGARPGGIYFYRLSAGNSICTARVVIAP